MEITLDKFESSTELEIGIISDTHGLLRPEAEAALKGSDLILHGGDVGQEEILHRLEAIASVYTVRGNVDFEYWCGRLPSFLTLTIADFKIHMIHDLSRLNQIHLREVSMVVYGHSHRPEIVDREGILYLNPGSAGPKRFKLPTTLAKLHWTKGEEKLSPELIQFD